MAAFLWVGVDPDFSPGDEMIAQSFGFTRDFVKEWNNNVYFRLNKIPCGFKEQARARQSGEKSGLTQNRLQNSHADINRISCLTEISIVGRIVQQTTKLLKMHRRAQHHRIGLQCLYRCFTVDF